MSAITASVSIVATAALGLAPATHWPSARADSTARHRPAHLAARVLGPVATTTGSLGRVRARRGSVTSTFAADTTARVTTATTTAGSASPGGSSSAPNRSSAPATGSPLTTTVPPNSLVQQPVNAAPAVGVTSPFVTACGTHLCLQGSPFPLYGGSVLNAMWHPSQEAAIAVSEHLNMVRVVNFLQESSTDVAHAPYDSAHWIHTDAEIAAAGAAGLHVILDLSTYRNLLLNNGINPYGVDWAPFVNFVTSRVNSVTGVRYRDDPTIAIISIAGEVDGLTVRRPTVPTPTQLVQFYTRTLNAIHAADTHHLASTGGLLHLDYNSGIPWKTIFSLPGNDVPAIHVYSAGDENITIPEVAAYAAKIGKPWIVEEFGFRQSLGDATRAADFQRVYDEAANAHAAGVLFWNVGTEMIGVNGKTESYDVSASTPLTFSTVIANASHW